MLGVTYQTKYLPTVFQLYISFTHHRAFPSGSDSKEFTYSDPWSWEDPLEKGMATHSSILAWRIPWTVKSGGSQSMGSQRV